MQDRLLSGIPSPLTIFDRLQTLPDPFQPPFLPLRTNLPLMSTFQDPFTQGPTPPGTSTPAAPSPPTSKPLKRKRQAATPPPKKYRQNPNPIPTNTQRHPFDPANKEDGELTDSDFRVPTRQNLSKLKIPKRTGWAAPAPAVTLGPEMSPRAMPPIPARVKGGRVLRSGTLRQGSGGGGSRAGRNLEGEKRGGGW